MKHYKLKLYINSTLFSFPGHDASAVESFTTNPGAENGHDGAADGTHHDESGAGHHGGIHVFVAEFERVEIPFIIALWIFCASLAKIGILFNFLRL